MSDLFGSLDPPAPSLTPPDKRPAPLAERLRPRSLDEVAGQDHVLGPDGPIGRMTASGRLSSLILWGPPGVGKTTIARLLAGAAELSFTQISAIFTGVADLRKVFDAARSRRSMGGGTLLFVDEIHRFNRAQQDSFLPHMEDGTLVLIGATTENPSFELNAALLSRAQVATLRRLDAAALEALARRAEDAEGLLPVTPEARMALIAMADGDGRRLLSMIEDLSSHHGPPLDAPALAQALSRRAPVYDKSGEGHFNLISALHKSVRGSDPQAALYWFARMLEGGEDPMYIARRVVRMAVEDIGLADPAALTQALAAKDTFEMLGSPEGELALAQAVVYVATAPKSNALYEAYKAVRKSAAASGSLPPPNHIVNAPTKWMKSEGYGEGYVYDPDAPDGFSGQNYFPDDMPREVYYDPAPRGFERDIRKRLEYWDKLRTER